MKLLAIRAAEKALWNLFDRHEWSDWITMLGYLRGASRFCGDITSSASSLLHNRKKFDQETGKEFVGSQILQNLLVDSWRFRRPVAEEINNEKVTEMSKFTQKSAEVKKKVEINLQALKLPLSGCCSAEIGMRFEKWCKSDKLICTKCDKSIHFAVDYSSPSHHGGAPGVFRDFNDDLWFAWQQTGHAEAIQELVSSGYQLVCQVKDTEATIESLHNRDADMISSENHRAFIRDWKNQVKNPEVVRYR